MRRPYLVMFGSLALVTATAGAALAQGESTTFQFAPGYGVPGAVVTMHGTGCVADGKAYDYAAVRFYDTKDTAHAHPRFQQKYALRTDGSFDGTLKVPDIAPATYAFVADCFVAGTPHSLVRTTFLVQAASGSRAPSAAAATSAPPSPGTATKTAAGTVPPSPARTPASTPKAAGGPKAAGTVAPAPRTVAETGGGGGSRARLAVVALLVVAGLGAVAVRLHRPAAPRP